MENLWTAFNDIKFTEETHIYTDSKNTKYSFEWIKTSILGKGNKGYLIAITFTGELTAANFILDTKTEEIIEKQHIKTKYEH